MRLNISRAARANVFVRPERLCSGGTVSRSPALGCLKTDPVRVQSPGRGVITILAGAVICLSTTVALAEGPLKFRDSQLEPIKWGELAGWTTDHLAAFATYGRAAKLCSNRDAANAKSFPAPCPASAARLLACSRRIPRWLALSSSRAFGRVSHASGQVRGLLTGYFEPIVAGSRFPTPRISRPALPPAARPEAAGYKPGSLALPQQRRGASVAATTERARATTTAPPSKPGARRAEAGDLLAQECVRPARYRSKARDA